MKPFEKQELEQCGFFSKLLGGKPAENAWKEINNILADATSAKELTADKVAKALKNWGVKFNDENMDQRSGIYRKLADAIYTNAQSTEDDLFAQGEHLAEVLELPPHLVKLANRGAKKASYFVRCNKLLKKEETLDINAINKIFGYDYEDGLSIRKQVFQNHFNMIFDDKICKDRRYTPDTEAELREDCAILDVPYEFKNNIANALDNYRNLWDAENKALGTVETDLPLREGEACRVYANCGLCKQETIEKEDNLFELTRKFNIDETVSFKGVKLEHPKIKEEITAVLELGYFFLTTQRIIYISQKRAVAVELEDITSADFDGINIITFHTKQGEDHMFKFSDEAGEVLYILFNRVKKGE